MALDANATLVFAYNDTHLVYKRNVSSLAVDGFIDISLPSGVTFGKLDATSTFALLLSDGSLWTWNVPVTGSPRPTLTAEGVENFFLDGTGRLVLLKTNGVVIRGGVEVEGLPRDRRVCSAVVDQDTATDGVCECAVHVCTLSPLVTN